MEVCLELIEEGLGLKMKKHLPEREAGDVAVVAWL